MDRIASGGLTEQRDVAGVAAEGGNVRLDPLQSGYLVQEAVIAFRTLRLGAERGVSEEAESSQSIIQTDEYDALASELRAVVFGRRSSAIDEAAAVDPHHHGEFCRAEQGSPHIQHQTIFGRSCPEGSRIFWKWFLHAVVAIVLGFKNTGPGQWRLGAPSSAARPREAGHMVRL